MTKAITIAISLDFPQLFQVGVSPEEAFYLANGEMLAFWVINENADNLTEALKLNSLYHTGDAIMANVLLLHNATFTDTAENQLVAISTAGAVGEQIGSLKISNNGVSDASVTIRIKDAAGTTTKIAFTETITTGSNLVAIDGLDKMNLLDTDQITVESDTAVSIDYYLSTLLGVSI